MKTAILADLHFSRYGQDRLNPKSRLPERLDSIIRCTLECLNYCVKNKISNVVFAGDIHHGKSIISTLAQGLIVDLIIERYKNINFTFIDGNHDKASEREGSLSSLKVFEKYSNVALSINGEMIPYSDKRILLIPYSKDLTEQIRGVKSGEYDCLISHFGLNEGQLSSGISIVSDIKLKDLMGKFKLVILGHYHKPQKIENKDITVYYVGSPIQLDWGERGENKRFLILNHDNWEVEEVKTTKYKKYVQFDLDENTTKTEVIEKARKLQEEGHHVVINKKGKVDTKDLDGEFLVVDKTDKNILDRGIHLDMPEEKRLEKFFSLKNVPEDEIKDYVTEAINIISKCSEKEGI